MLIPAGHWHTPAMQVVPPLQPFPQVPQLLGSDVRSTQALLH
jgi:hypothetical protein